MALKVISQIETGKGTVAKSIVADTAEDYVLLQQLVQRGANLWPDAPAEIKRLADIVTSGQVMQEYGNHN